MAADVRILACLAGFVLGMGCALLAAGAAPRPNIVYILADDLGWKDVGFHGGAIKTPHLDALAQSGARLERFYAQAYSSSTRAALLTGRHPMRYGLQTLSVLPWSQYGLPTDEHLLPEALKQAGYRTAMLGKWQLGHYKKDLWPTRRGFESFYGNFNGDLDCVRKTNVLRQPDWYRNDRPIREDGYCTTLIGREAARIIERHDRIKPLFLFLSFSAPQSPMTAPQAYLDRFSELRDPDQRAYAAVVTALDDAIGKVIAALEGSGMTQETLVIFHSDNGGAVPTQYPSGDGDIRRQVANNGPYRDGKGSLYEGSLRVVAIASWPGQIPPGIVTEPIHVTDMHPTLLGLAGTGAGQIKPLDGINQWPAIAEAKLSPRRELLLGMEDFRAALMVDDWKLIVYSRLPVRHELYQVQDDPSEEDNRASREPRRVQDMLERLNEYAWEMAPSLYLEDLRKPRSYASPTFWGDNPKRP